MTEPLPWIEAPSLDTVVGHVLAVHNYSRVYVEGADRTDLLAEHDRDHADERVPNTHTHQAGRIIYPPPPTDPHGELVRALLGDDRERERLWHTSATFHASIETLASLLPAWVDGLALRAAHEELMAVHAATKAMTNTPKMRITEEQARNMRLLD